MIIDFGKKQNTVSPTSGKTHNEPHQDWEQNFSYLKQMISLKKIKDRIFFSEDVEIMPYTSRQNEICQQYHSHKIHAKWRGISTSFNAGMKVLTCLEISWRTNGIPHGYAFDLHQTHNKFVEECKNAFSKFV